MDGILIIDKPAGITSHDVVSRVRRILKTRRVGHTGTLDPFATGVMVILVGKATRLAQFLDKDEKQYEAIVAVGYETDTGDRTGQPIVEPAVQPPTEIDLHKINPVLGRFRGEIEQTPPMYSAKKIGGRKLYESARKGLEVERSAVTVVVHDILAYYIDDDARPDTFDLPVFGLRVRCSAGTYIRTLAQDIGRALDMRVHLAELRRTAAGIFDLAAAVELGELEKAEDPAATMLPVEAAVSHLPALALDDDRIAATRNGLFTRVPDAFDFAGNTSIRMVSGEGRLLAVGSYDASERIVQPKVVLI